MQTTPAKPPTYYPLMGLMRYIMALGVIISHYNVLTGAEIPCFIGSFECVGGFFALSGFLMYPSAVKAKRVKTYISSRALRIMPSYIFTIVICAFGLSIISTLQPYEYFTSSTFWKYLGANLCFLNWLEPNLPGVFQSGDYVMSAVNGSLWTMKIEWCLYLSVPIFLLIINRFNLSRAKFALFVILLSYVYRIAFTILFDHTGSEIYNILGRQFFGQLAYFYFGMLAYFYRDYIAQRKWITLTTSIIICLLSPWVPFGNIILTPIALTGICISVSMMRATAKKCIHDRNLSYDMYLVHFPIIQLCVYLGISQYNVLLGFSFSIIATILLSYICYEFVEKPIRINRRRQ